MGAKGCINGVTFEMSSTASESETESASFESHNFAAKKLSSQRILLTYSRCPHSPEDIIAYLNEKKPIDKAIGCIELHETNQEAIDDHFAPTGEWPHVHIALRWKTKATIRKADWFDYEGYHPNIQIVRVWGKSVNYCRKKFPDGEPQYLELYYFQCSPSDVAKDSSKSQPDRIDDLYDLARSMEGERNAFYNTCRKAGIAYPYTVDAWKTVWQSALHTTGEPTPTTDPRRLARVSPYLQHLRFDDDLCTTLVVLGPAGCGKTFWAALQLYQPQFRPCLIVGEKDDLKDWNSGNYRSILFDECDAIDHTPGDKYTWSLKNQIAAVDRELPRTIRGRYFNARIARGVPRIWTCTHTWPFIRDYQTARRCRFINLYYDDPETHWAKTSDKDQEVWSMEEFMVELPDV